jgi:hypothetical protein
MKTKIIKRKFEDQENTRTTPDEDAAADAAADAVNPSTPPHGGRSSRSRHCPAGWSLYRPVLPPALRAWALRASGWLGVVGRMLGPKADAE